MEVLTNDPITNVNNGFISGKLSLMIHYDKWLTGVPDYDEPFLYGLNWIRSGLIQMKMMIIR